jgi:type IV secretion system protein VirB8
MQRDAIKKTGAVSDYYQSARSWHEENYESLYCSRNRYRLFSFAVCVLLGLCIAAITAVLPLKQYIYRIIEVNKQTGELTVLKELEGNRFPVAWAMDRYFINQYIQEREGYSFEDIKRNYNLVIAMSGQTIANQYMADTVDTNPNSPIKRFNDRYYKEVKVLSINSLNKNTAIARYQTLLHNKDDVNDVKTEDAQAVIKWDYIDRAKPPAERDKNPLGFTVTYYQISPVFAEK